MNRPSHWILASFLVAGTALWVTGGLEDERAPNEPQPAVADHPVAPKVVHRETPPPAPAVHELTGRVVDRFGHPIVAAKIDRVGGRTAAVETDADGAFRVRWIGPLAGHLEISAPGRHATTYRAPELEPMQVVLQDVLPWQVDRPAVQRDPARLLGEGFLIDATGRHVAGGRVAIRESGATAVTDDSGRYRIPLAPGPQTLVAWDAAGRVARSDTIEPSHREGLEPLPELVLGAGPRVGGRVLDSDGGPAADVAVELRFEGAVRVVHTDTDGTFAIPALGDSTARLTVFPYRGHLGVRHELVIGGHGDVALGDIPLELPADEPLRMRVVDIARHPQPSVHVVAEQAGGLCRAYGRADSTGSVWLSGLGAHSSLKFEVRDVSLDVLPIQDFDPTEPALIVAR